MKRVVNICIHYIQNYFSDCNSAGYTLSFGRRGSYKGDFRKCNTPISKEIDSWIFLVHNVDLGEKENIFEHNQLVTRYRNLFHFVQVEMCRRL